MQVVIAGLRGQHVKESTMPSTSGKPAAATAGAIQTVNPATGENGEVYRAHTLDEAKAIAASCAVAQRLWRKSRMVERSRLMHTAAQVMRANKSRYAALMTAEMGKTVTDGLSEIEKCAWTADYFADHAEAFLAPRPRELGDGRAGNAPSSRAFVTFNPLGVVLAVMPWNFPFWQVMRFCAPHLMAGNGGVLKHASNVPGCALALEEIFRDAGFPRDLFRTVLIGSQHVKALIEDPSIAAVTLTGSVSAGKTVAAAAGAVLKKVVLELGGSDGYIVLEDADIERAAQVCAAARMVNAGQSCIAGKRFVVLESVQATFEAAFVEAMRGYRIGDPNDPTTKLGPLQSVKARDEVAGQVTRSVARGARVLLGGELPARTGAWYPATVLTGVTAGQPAHDEEVFGPVAAVISARTEADAIHIVNDCQFGLGNAVLTRDLARGERIAAEELESGLAFVNQNVRSDARLPFGGVKESGYGRELSEYGIYEFCNIKSVFVQG
jgi:succinate-semialdehyde dehydrogenase / glutarate-semialdehyde dehydrogenase